MRTDDQRRAGQTTVSLFVYRTGTVVAIRTVLRISCCRVILKHAICIYVECELNVHPGHAIDANARIGGPRGPGSAICVSRSGFCNTHRRSGFCKMIDRSGFCKTLDARGSGFLQFSQKKNPWYNVPPPVWYLH